MKRITWNRLAEAELLEIKAYISKDSKLYASHWARKIRARTSNLKRHPEIGRMVENNINIPELIVGDYRVVYWYGGTEEVIILRVLHTARDVK